MPASLTLQPFDAKELVLEGPDRAHESHRSVSAATDVIPSVLARNLDEPGGMT
jgi:hypothetical protein